MLQLRDLYRGVAVHATADDEHAAALELLLLVVVADGAIKVDETEAIEQLTDDFEWNSTTFSFATEFGNAMAKVREARVTPGGTAALLDEIDARIASRVLRSELVAACREVAHADHDLAPEEAGLLATIEARFS